MGVFWIGSDGGGLGWRALGRGVSMGGGADLKSPGEGILDGGFWAGVPPWSFRAEWEPPRQTQRCAPCLLLELSVILLHYQEQNKSTENATQSSSH